MDSIYLGILLSLYCEVYGPTVLAGIHDLKLNVEARFVSFNLSCWWQEGLRSLFAQFGTTPEALVKEEESFTMGVQEVNRCL